MGDRTPKTFKLQTQILTIFLFILFLVPTSAYAQAQASVTLSPTSINIAISKGLSWDVPSVPPLTVDLGNGPGNVSIANVFSTDLLEANHHGMIPAASIRVVAPTAIQSYQVVQLTITLNLPTSLPSGTYTGELRIVFSGGVEKDVPMAITIGDSPIWAIAFVSIGAVLSLLLALMRDAIGVKNQLGQAMTQCYNALVVAQDSIRKANAENRMDASYLDAVDLFGQLVDEFQQGKKNKLDSNDYSSMATSAARVKALADSAVPRQTPVPPWVFSSSDLTQALPPQPPAPYTLLWDWGRGPEYVALAVTVFVVVLGLWGGFVSNLPTFGAAGYLDYASAILYGFGSQAIIGQSIGMGQAWLQSRQP